MAMLECGDTTLPPARFSRICIRLEGHVDHPSWACEVCLERHVCFECVARLFEQKMPSLAKVGMTEELACVLTELAPDARLRAAQYLFHSTTFIDSICSLDFSIIMSIDEACRSSHGQEQPPYDPTRLTIKLHSMLLRNGPPQEPLLILLNKVMARTRHQPLHVLQDPELWWNLTRGLSVALKTAEQKATLIVQAFSLVLEDTEESASRALISACFHNIAGSLELLKPSHPSAASFLEAVSRCINFPGVLSEVAQTHTIQIQLGQVFQTIFASHETAPGVQELAIHLVERLFPSLPDKQKTLFLDELCIIDWLLEVDWRPDLSRAAMVIDLAVTSMCQQQQQAGCVNAGIVGVSDLLKRLEADQQKNIKLDASSGPEWACGVLSLAAHTIHAYNKEAARQVDAGKPPHHAWLHIRNASLNNWKATQREITQGFLQLLEMDTQLLPCIDCELDDEAAQNLFALADVWLQKGRALPGLTACASQLVQYDMLLSSENASPILARDGFRSFPLDDCSCAADSSVWSAAPAEDDFAAIGKMLGGSACSSGERVLPIHQPDLGVSTVAFQSEKRGRESMKSLKDESDTFSKDAALALGVAGVLVIHLTACSETTTDAAVLCLCALFTCGSIDSLLRSCLLNTTFSLVPLCNKCIRLASRQQDMLLNDLRRGSRSLLSIIHQLCIEIIRSIIFALVKVLDALSRVEQDPSVTPTASRAARMLRLRLQDIMQSEGEKPSDSEGPIDMKCNSAQNACDYFDAACVPLPFKCAELREAAGQMASQGISEKLLSVILHLVDEPRTYTAVDSFLAPQRQ
ncbi:hypothetical protein Emed_002648 [Eimeria media]